MENNPSFFLWGICSSPSGSSQSRIAVGKNLAENRTVPLPYSKKTIDHGTDGGKLEKIYFRIPLMKKEKVCGCRPVANQDFPLSGIYRFFGKNRIILGFVEQMLNN